MKLASPDKIIKIWYPHFSIKSLLGLQFNRLSAAQESTGYKSVSYVGNMSTYLFMIIGIIGGIIGLVFLATFCVCHSKMKGFFKKKVEKTKKKTGSFNV